MPSQVLSCFLYFLIIYWNGGTLRFWISPYKIAWADIHTSLRLNLKKEFRWLKNPKNIEMFNNSRKCIANCLCVLNVLGLVFDSESIYIVFKGIFFTKFLVNLISNFSGFWSKTIYPSNVFLKYFIFTWCAINLSTDRVFICICSPISLENIKFFHHFFFDGRFLDAYS